MENVKKIEESKEVSIKNEFEEFFLSETAVLEVETPTGKPLLRNGQPVRIHVYAPGSSEYEKAKAALDSAATRKVLAALGKNGKKEESDDKQADVNFLVSVTKEIENFPYPNGSRGVYSEPRLIYINKQVQSFLGDMSNFFGGAQQD